MPANAHLSWTEVRDFSPGLWETDDWLMPATAAQTMLDCYPRPGGGLRAFFAPTSTVALTGIDAADKPVALFMVTLPHRTLTTLAEDMYLVTWNGTDHARLYRWDHTDAGETQWTQKKSFATHTGSLVGPFFASFKMADGTLRVLVSLAYASSDDGIWAADPAIATGTQSFAKVTGSIGGPIAIHQARVMEGRGSVLWFTDEGTLTFGADNFIDIEPARNWPSIQWMAPSPPGDLLLGREGDFVNVQGDIDAATVRMMSEGHYSSAPQVPARTPDGIAFMEANGGIYRTGFGSSFERLDQGLYPPRYGASGLINLGGLAWDHRWLWTPSGVYDTETKSWFRLTDISGANLTHYYWANKFKGDSHRVYAVRAGTTPAIKVYESTEGYGTRATSYTWKSAPFRADDGRQMRIREVQVYAHGFNTAAAITVTVGGVSRSATVGNAKQMLSFLFNARDEVQDVQVVACSNTSGEAPAIEVVRIGRGDGHQLR